MSESDGRGCFISYVIVKKVEINLEKSQGGVTLPTDSIRNKMERQIYESPETVLCDIQPEGSVMSWSAIENLEENEGDWGW